jgi:KaiC/GvpD/RAD55 family RecA-like ATPase
MAKIRSGVEGLDRLIGGGFPPKSAVLVSGTPGTGKTILSLQFIAEGALRHGHKGIYITFEENKDKIREQAMRFGWNLRTLEGRGLVRLMTISKLSLGQIFSEIRTAIDEFRPKRLAIDSLTYIALAAHSRERLVELEKTPTDEAIFGGEQHVSTAAGWDSLIVRRTVIDLVQFLQQNGICTILTSEVSKNSEWYSRDTLSEFTCDGIIHLRATSIGSELHRSLEVVKMRNTKIEGGTYEFDFSRKGIVVQH